MMTGNPTCLAHSRASPSRQDPFRAGQDRNSGLFHRLAGLFLLAHQAGNFRRRTDELDVAGFADFGKIGVFRQQAVAGMDGIYVGDFRRADDGRNIQIAQGKLRRPDANGFIGKPHWQRIAIGLTVDGDRADAQFLAGADHAQGNFAAVCDQNFLKHASGSLRLVSEKFSWFVGAEKGAGRAFNSFCYFFGRMVNSSCPYSMGCPFVTRIFTISPVASDSISFISFMASTMHKHLAGFHCIPWLYEGRRPRRRRLVVGAYDRRTHHVQSLLRSGLHLLERTRAVPAHPGMRSSVSPTGSAGGAECIAK